MFRWGVVWAVLALVLSGCASQRMGTDYLTISQKMGPPRPGQSRIVVMSVKTLVGAGCDLSVDGNEVGKVKPGTYIYADRPAGRHLLLATQTLFPGDTKRDITTESGRTYFFQIKNSDRTNAMVGFTMLGGLVGMGVAAAATSGNENPGPVDFIPLDEAAAQTTLESLQLSD
jgi:hypothetical protein